MDQGMESPGQTLKPCEDEENQTAYYDEVAAKTNQPNWHKNQPGTLPLESCKNALESPNQSTVDGQPCDCTA